jgi:hypothetical protein
MSGTPASAVMRCSASWTAAETRLKSMTSTWPMERRRAGRSMGLKPIRWARMT